MADAVPAIPVEEPVPAPTKTTKKTSNGISEDVLAEIRAQVKEEVMAELKPQPASYEPGVNPFKVEGGRSLESHEAVREDF